MSGSGDVAFWGHSIFAYLVFMLYCTLKIWYQFVTSIETLPQMFQIQARCSHQPYLVNASDNIYDSCDRYNMWHSLESYTKEFTVCITLDWRLSNRLKAYAVYSASSTLVCGTISSVAMTQSHDATHHRNIVHNEYIYLQSFYIQCKIRVRGCKDKKLRGNRSYSISDQDKTIYLGKISFCFISSFCTCFKTKQKPQMQRISDPAVVKK